MKSQAQKARLNLELPQRLKRRIEALVKRTEAASISEVLRRALALYDFCIEARESGDTIEIRKPDGTSATIRFL